MHHFDSSAISAADYDAASQQMDVQFTSGSKWYTHYRVPASVYYGFITASSAGSYYHDHIRGRYGP